MLAAGGKLSLTLPGTTLCGTGPANVEDWPSGPLPPATLAFGMAIGPGNVDSN